MENEKNHRDRLTILTSSASALLLIVVFFVAFLPGIQERAAVETMSSAPGVEVQEAAEDPLLTFRTERGQIRELEMRQLNEIIAAEPAGTEIRAAAERQLMAICDFMEKEVTIEGVLRARGYADALATVSGDSVNILVRQPEITKEDSAIMLELAMRETGVSGGNVKIIPIK